MKIIKQIPATFIIIVIWGISFIIGLNVNIINKFANHGFNILENEYYRFVTGLFLHINFLHFLINMITLFLVGSFLEEQVGAIKYLFFSIFIGTISEIIFSWIYKDSISVGGSAIIFALIGLIFVYQLFKSEASKFHLGTWYGNWIVGYALLGNIPIFSNNISTLIIHLIALIMAFFIGYICVKVKIL